MIVYDITDKQTFRAVEGWMSEVEKYASANVQILLIGNKSDAEELRQVSYDEGLVEFISN